MMEPKVSVIIPTFNRLQYLKEALKSVEEQTYRNVEILVLDDGSQDGTLDYLKNYVSALDFRWYPFTAKERSFLRNYGATISTGQYLAFLDDDDRWFKEKLTKQVEFFQTNKEVGMIFGRTTTIDSQGCPEATVQSLHKKLYRRYARTRYTYQSLAEGCLIFTSTVMVKKDLFLVSGGYRSEYNALEDLDLYLRFSLIAPLACTPGKPLAAYRVHAGNSGVEKLTNAAFQVCASQLEFLQKNPTIDPSGIARNGFMFMRIRYHYWLRQYDEALTVWAVLLKNSLFYCLHGERLLFSAKLIFKWLLNHGRMVFYDR